MPILQVDLTDTQLDSALRAFGFRNQIRLESELLLYITGRVLGEEVNTNVQAVSDAEVLRTRAALESEGWVLPPA